jgi:hypothetical protein
MIPALICAVSFLTLLQFFVSYSRSMIAECRCVKLSAEACEICGVTSGTAAGNQFRRLVKLISLCPQRPGDNRQVRIVAVYFHFLGLVRLLLNWAMPSASRWIESERSGCAYLAAVVLDRRIAYTRMMMAQQSSH